MKLYITPGSPYARIVRILILEKGLAERVAIEIAKTRRAMSPYYDINPSGRVPYLVRDQGAGLEESTLICAYLDHIDGKPAFALPTSGDAWDARRLEALARSMLDGLAVWGRELRRPVNERSPTIVQHETDRALRMVDLWEREIDAPLLQGTLNIIQITLGCTLGFASLIPDFAWRQTHPKLAAWFARIEARPSFTATAPPDKH